MLNKGKLYTIEVLKNSRYVIVAFCSSKVDAYKKLKEFKGEKRRIRVFGVIRIETKRVD